MSGRMDASHVAYLLPGYAAGTLDHADRRRVLAHLPGCPACRAELVAWRAIGEAAREAYGEASSDSDAPLRAVWRRIDAPTDNTGTKRAETERSPLLESAAPRPARARPGTRALVRESLNQLATAALLLLTLAGIYVSFVQHRSGSDGTAPDAADVPLFRGGPARTGEMPGPGPRETPTMRWRSEVLGTVMASPVVADGLVYVGGETGILYALDAETGAERWRFGASGPIGAAPAVVDGVVYLGDQTGTLTTLDAGTGRVLWTQQIGASLYVVSPVVVDGVVYVASGGGASSPAVADGVVYVGGDGSPSSPAKVLHAHDAATGAALWRFPQAGGSLNRHGLYAIAAATGQQMWHLPTRDLVRVAPAVADGVVYVGSKDGSVHAVDAADGRQVWRFDTGAPVYASPAVAGGVVYAAGTGGVLYAVDAASGDVRWSLDVGPVRNAAVAVAGGAVYVVAGGALQAVDAESGRGLWQVATGDRVDTSPVVVNGLVYVGSPAPSGAGAVLAAFGEEEGR